MKDELPQQMDVQIEENSPTRKEERARQFSAIVENAFAKIDSRDATDSVTVLSQLAEYQKVPDEASDELLVKLIKVLMKFVPANVKDEKSKKRHYAAVSTFFKFVKHRKMLDRLRSNRKELGRLQLKKLVLSEDEAAKTLGVDLALFLMRNLESVVPRALVDNDESAFAVVQRQSELATWNMMSDHQKKLKAVVARMTALESAVSTILPDAVSPRGPAGAQLGAAGDMNDGDGLTFETLNDVVEEDAPQQVAQPGVDTVPQSNQVLSPDQLDKIQ